MAPQMSVQIWSSYPSLHRSFNWIQCTSNLLRRQDITMCQNNNKTVLLSMGGDSAQALNVSNFPSKEAAATNAEMIWNMFGPNTSNKTVVRPFGKAAINGFDLDIEAKTTNLVPWATKMRELMGEGHYLTAAPQCPKPDENLLKDLLSGVEFDMVFVQFYNNPQCSPNTGTTTVPEWSTWASANSTKFFIGLPAGSTAVTDNGYLKPDNMTMFVKETKGRNSFGGVMLWDASQSWSNENYHVKVKQALEATP
jgi:chitinase